LHDNKLWNSNRKVKAVICVLIAALNIFAVFMIVCVNGPFTDIPDDSHWYQHEQYASLARSFAQGRVDIDIHTDTEQTLAILDTLDNPYDIYERGKAFSETEFSSPWDIAYYNGNFYVYFGAVPVILMYLPYHLITGADLPNVATVFIALSAVICSAFVFMRSLVKRYFPSTPYSIYLVLSILLANSVGTLQYAFAPSFYALPIILSTAFVFFGLALWLSAPTTTLNDQIDSVSNAEYTFPVKRPGRFIYLKLIFGSLFMALTAGCRPPEKKRRLRSSPSSTAPACAIFSPSSAATRSSTAAPP